MEPIMIGDEHVRVVKAADQPRTVVRYDPTVFVQESFEASKAIVLIEEVGLTTDERWARETAWLMERVKFETNGMILDYGCGVGRLSKDIPQAVLGVDISSSMRWHAENYCQRRDFATCNQPMLAKMVSAGLRFCGGLAVWVLQHVLDPNYDCALIAEAILPGATFWLVNRDIRVLPVLMSDGSHDWASDHLNPESILTQWFTLEERHAMPADLCIEGAYISRWSRNQRGVEWDAPPGAARAPVGGAA